jgi:hypothetical protein
MMQPNVMNMPLQMPHQQTQVQHIVQPAIPSQRQDSIVANHPDVYQVNNNGWQIEDKNTDIVERKEASDRKYVKSDEPDDIEKL